MASRIALPFSESWFLQPISKQPYSSVHALVLVITERLDFRWAHDFKLKTGNNMNILQLSVDVKNILNMFNNSWGVAKFMNSKLDSGRILKYESMDAEGYPVFSTPAAVNGSVDTWVTSKAIGQCWYAQVGIKYMFN